MSAPEAPEKKRGCFFYGCIVSMVLLVVLLVGAFLVVRYAAGRFNALVAEYTDTSPMALPKVDMPADEYAKLKDRVAAFQKALDAHTNSLQLVLTSRDLNALLANSSNGVDFKDKVYVSLEGNQTKGQISMPLDQVHIPLINTKGRYLNGSGTFDVSITNGVLTVVVQSLEAKGKPLPEKFMAGVRNQNWAEKANSDPQQSATINQIQSLQVKDSTLIITPKTN
jgi:hypothetical protein